MRTLACLLVPFFLATGCGPAASIDRVSSDLSGRDPVLQVWCHAKRLEEGADIKVQVEWNKNLGTGPVSPTAVRADHVVVVPVAQWALGAAAFDRENEMEIRFVYNGDILAHRKLTTPSDFSNAFSKVQSAPSTEQPASAPR